MWKLGNRVDKVPSGELPIHSINTYRLWDLRYCSNMTVPVVVQSSLKAFDSSDVILQLWGKDHVVVSEGLLL